MLFPCVWLEIPIYRVSQSPKNTSKCLKLTRFCGQHCWTLIFSPSFSVSKNPCSYVYAFNRNVIVGELPFANVWMKMLNGLPGNLVGLIAAAHLNTCSQVQSCLLIYHLLSLTVDHICSSTDSPHCQCRCCMCNVGRVKVQIKHVRPWLDCSVTFFEIDFKRPLVNDFEYGCHVWFCSSVEDRHYSSIHLCVSWCVRIFEEFSKKLWDSPSYFSKGVKDM